MEEIIKTEKSKSHKEFEELLSKDMGSRNFKEGEIKFLHVDLVKLPKWGKKFKVGGIPDIRIYHEGELGQYAGKRDYKTIWLL